MALCNFPYTEYLVLPIFASPTRCKAPLPSLRTSLIKYSQVNQLSQSTFSKSLLHCVLAITKIQLFIEKLLFLPRYFGVGNFSNLKTKAVPFASHPQGGVYGLS